MIESIKKEKLVSFEIKKYYFAVLVPLIFIVTVLIARVLVGHLLFHALAEMFPVLVGISMAIVSYFTYNFTKNNFLLYLGIGYFWIAILDLFHMLTFQGMLIYPIDNSNITLTFWIFTRLFETLLIITALFINFSIVSKIKIFIIFGLVSVLIYFLAFSQYAPSFFIENIGLTDLKVYLEYFIIFLLAVALYIYKLKKDLLDNTTYKYMIASIIFTMLAEFTLTFYVDIYGYLNVAGHLFKFLSYWMIFLAIIKTSLEDPFTMMAQESNTYDAIPMPVIVVDSNGIVRQINRATESFLDLSKDAIIHNSNHTLFHDANIEESECKLCKVIQNGGTLSSYELYKNSHTYSFTISPIYLSTESAGSIQVCIDISENKFAEHELKQSQQFLRTVIESNPECIKLVDSKGKLLDMNKAGLEMLQADTLDEAKSHTLASYILPEWRVPFIKLHKDVMNGNNGILEFEIEGLKGTHRWLKTHAVPMRDADGKINMLLGITRDVTERRQSEHELKILKAAIEQVPVSIVITDIHGNIQFVNPYFTLVTGYTAKEAIGQNPRVLASGYTTKDEYEGLYNTIIHKEAWKGVFKNIKKNGEEYWETAIISPIVDKDGTITNYIGVKQDISEKVAMESLLKDQEEMMIAQSRHAAMGEMIGMIAHQWRQPLTVISMGANNMLLDIEMDDISPSTFKNEARLIIEQVHHLSRTIEDFRNFFRPDNEKESVDVKDIISETFNIIGKGLEHNEIKINFSFDFTTPIKIYKRELIQVLINLINNSKEAMIENTKGEKVLFISTKEETDSVIIEVCDNGGGIKQDIINKIFEPYFSTKDKLTGTGLGLYMSKTIITEHLRGDIRAKNNQIGGACMVITLYKENQQD
jgi:PAS domain S-box-containing protein